MTRTLFAQQLAAGATIAAYAYTRRLLLGPARRLITRTKEHNR